MKEVDPTLAALEHITSSASRARTAKPEERPALLISIGLAPPELAEHMPGGQEEMEEPEGEEY